MKHLLVTQDFPPDLGGMARRHYELARCFPGNTMSVSTVAAEGSDGANGAQPFPVLRQPFDFAAAKRFTSQMRWATWLTSNSATYRAFHCGNLRPVGYAVWWASRRSGVPYFVYVNGGDLLIDRAKSRQWHKRLSARRILGDSAGVVANSTWTAGVASDFMREIGVATPPPVAAIDLGTDPDRFHPRRDSGSLRRRYDLGDAPLLLTVARLVPHKGQDVGIRAFAQLAGDFPTLRYLLVGEGPDLSRLTALAEELGVADRVIFAGALGDDETAEAYATATVYVGPSRLDRERYVEGFGISFVEAGASGTPVVASNSGGIRSAVRHGETGLLVPAEDPAAFAEAIRSLLTDEPRRLAMGRAGRAAVESHYNWDRVARETSAFVDGVLAGRRAR